MGGASVLAETAPDATSALHSFAWSVLNRLQTLVEPRSMKSALAGAGATLPRPPSRPPSEGLRLRNAAERRGTWRIRGQARCCQAAAAN